MAFREHWLKWQKTSDDVRYVGPSFATIAGSGPNGAIVHYRADETSNRRSRSTAVRTFEKLLAALEYGSGNKQQC